MCSGKQANGGGRAVGVESERIGGKTSLSWGIFYLFEQNCIWTPSTFLIFFLFAQVSTSLVLLSPSFLYIFVNKYIAHGSICAGLWVQKTFCVEREVYSGKSTLCETEKLNNKTITIEDSSFFVVLWQSKVSLAEVYSILEEAAKRVVCNFSVQHNGCLLLF